MIVFPMGKPKTQTMLLVSLAYGGTNKNTTIVQLVQLACENSIYT